MHRKRRERLERQRQNPPPPVIGFQRYPSREPKVDAKVYGFMHICMINHYKEIIEEQIKLMVDSGLYEKCTSIFLGCVGADKELQEVRRIIAPYPKMICLKSFLSFCSYSNLIDSFTSECRLKQRV